MSSTATTRGKYRKQGLGDGLNTWGLTDGLNGVFDVMDAAIHGVEVMALTGNKTLSSTNYVENESRYRALAFTDSSLSAAPTITIPATENWWLVNNQTTYVLTFSNGSSTATVPASREAFVWTDGTTVYSRMFFETGDQTYPGGLAYTYSSTTTNADPGAGFLRLDNATPSSATGIYISDTEGNAVDVSSYLVTWDDSTSSTYGQIFLRSIENAEVFHIYDLTALTDNTGYVDITVSYVGGSGSLVNGESVVVTFLRTGDQGATGAQGPAGGTLSAETFTATAGQTTFTTSGGYATGALEVFLNGVLLKSTTDYTATNGSTIVLVSPAVENDILYARTFSNATTFSQDPSNIAVTGGTASGLAITSSTINSTVIGGTSAAAGTFTTLGGTTITATTSFRGVDLGSGNTSDVNFTTSGGNQFRIKHRASAVNVFAAQGSATGNDVFLFTEGADTNIDLAYVLKGSAQFLTYNAGGGTLLTTLNSAGDFLPGTTESQDLGSASLEWDNLFVQNAVTVSDRRFKSGISDIPYGLNFINALRPRSYKYKDKTVKIEGVDADGKKITRDKSITYSRKHTGLIAQEVKAAMDDLGISTDDFAGFVDASVNGGPDRLMLRYLEFIPPLIKAVQELSARVEALETKETP